MLVDQFLQLFIEHMRVDLRGRNVRMAQKFLHGAEVGAVLQQVAGKGVAEHMWRDGSGGNAGAGGERFQVTGKDLARQIASLLRAGKSQGLSGPSLAAASAFRAAP